MWERKPYDSASFTRDKMTIQHLKIIINKLKEFLSFYSFPGLVLNTGDLQMHKLWILPWKTFRLKHWNIRGTSLQDWLHGSVEYGFWSRLPRFSHYEVLALLVVWDLHKISNLHLSFPIFIMGVLISSHSEQCLECSLWRAGPVLVTKPISTFPRCPILQW